MTHHLIAGLFAATGWVLQASADTTINPVQRYAYGANIGWIDARADVTNGVVLGHHYARGYLWSGNVGWLCLGHGPANGWSYANASATDWGVNHDGAGKLSGYAYGANIGWLTFEQTHGQPTVDLLTGALSGSVWGANIGWISLSNVQAFVQTDRLDTGPDKDGDGIPDPWELKVAGDLDDLGPAPADWDGDGASDVAEALADTDPFDGSSLLLIHSFSRSGGADAVAWPVAPTRLYRLMQTDALQPGPPAWVDSGLGLLQPGGAATLLALVDSPATTQRFYRVRALLPLAE